MAQIILKRIGSEKIKVIKIYREVTGMGLKESKEAVDAVSNGMPSVISGIAMENVQNIIAQFRDAGAEVYEDTLGNMDSDFSSLISTSEGNSRDLLIMSKEKTEPTQEDLSGAESSEVYVEDQFQPIVASNMVSKLEREETMAMLIEVGKIANALEESEVELKRLANEKSAELRQAEYIRETVSSKATLIIWTVNIIAAVIGTFIIPVVMTLVFWIISAIIMNKTVKKSDLEKHKNENNVKADAYINEHVVPIEERINEVYAVREDIINSGKQAWAVDIVGKDMFYSACIKDLYDLIKNRRADNLKEALNKYDDTLYKKRMEEMQETIQQASLVSAMEATKQTESMKEIERHAQSAAKTAKVNAAINYGTYRNTKKINQKLK